MIDIVFYISSGVVVFILLLFLSALWPPDSPWSPKWRTKKEVANKLISFANLQKQDVLIDLGSGDGAHLLYITKKTGAKCIGIEIDPLRHVVANMRKIFSGQSDVTFVRRDFKKTRFEKATVLYAYLVPNALSRLTEKILTECKQGTRVITYRYKIPVTSSQKRRLELVSEDNSIGLYLYIIK